MIVDSMNLTKRILLFFLLPLFFQTALSQTGYRWLTTMGGPNFSEFGLDVDVDDFGNIYVGGEFYDGAVIGGTTYTSQGDNDLFVARMSPYGDVEWVATYGSTQLDRVYAVQAGPDGSVYMTGYGKVAFPTRVTGPAAHARDALVARFDDQGTLIWGRNMDGDIFSEGSDIVGNTLGESYMSGRMETYSAVDGDTLWGAGDVDGMIYKWGPNGEFYWSRSIGGTGEDDIYAIGKDRNDNLVVGGFYTGSASAGSFSLVGVDQEDAFLAKLDSSGGFQWAISFAGMGTDKVKALKVAEDGSIYFVGEFENTINIGGNVLTASSANDIFLGKAHPNGSIAWVQRIGGTSLDQAEDLDIDQWENIYLGGFYFGTFEIGTVTETSGGFDDMFIAKLDSNGNLQSSSFPHFYSTRDVFGVAADPQQNIVASGSFIELIDLLGDTVYAVNNSMDIFVTKYATLPESMIIDSVTGLDDCVDSLFYIHYSLLGYFDNTNAFEAQLSNPTGGFGGAPTVGSVATGVGGVIPALVPPNAVNGTAYRVRMRSTSPPIFSGDNGVDLSIQADVSPGLVLGGDTVICNGNNAFVSISGDYASQIWSNGATTPFAVFSQVGNEWVQVTDTNGCARTLHFQVVDCTPLDNRLEEGIYLYPNPNAGHFRLLVETGGMGEWEFAVYDVEGRLVYEESFLEAQDRWEHGIELSVMAEGMYFAYLRGTEGVWTGRIAVNR